MMAVKATKIARLVIFATWERGVVYRMAVVLAMLTVNVTVSVIIRAEIVFLLRVIACQIPIVLLARSVI